MHNREIESKRFFWSENTILWWWVFVGISTGSYIMVGFGIMIMSINVYVIMVALDGKQKTISLSVVALGSITGWVISTWINPLHMWV